MALEGADGNLSYSYHPYSYEEAYTYYYSYAGPPGEGNSEATTQEPAASAPSNNDAFPHYYVLSGGAAIAALAVLILGIAFFRCCRPRRQGAVGADPPKLPFVVGP